MKKLVVLSSLALAILSSCATQKMGTSTYNDDVYANPKEDRIEEARIKEEKRLAQATIDKRYNDSIAAIAQAQKEKDDANPYYKEREFKYDDYYDYEYATRLKRFDNNIGGLSYYDNYYTNSYFYSGNPYNYGVSVYNGYSWWGSSYNNYSYNPSVSFYSSWGWGYGNQFNMYNGYNPYMAGYAQGYNNGFSNGMYGNYYGYGNPYGYGGYYGDPYAYGGYGGYGYGGYGNPYNNGWGYYNVYDNNSSYTYGPRSSHGGGNSRRTSNPGVSPVKREESPSDKYIREVAQQQAHNPRFGETTQPVRVNNTGTPVGTGGIKPVRENTPVGSNTPIRSNDPIDNPIRVNEGMDPVRQPTSTTPVRINDQPIRNNPNINEPIRNNPGINEPVRNQSTTTPRNETPVRQNPIRNVEPVKETPRNETPRMETPRSNDFQLPSNSPTNNGGGNSSPGGNSGGGHRPR
ncbi:MAG: hypothetical protein V4677_18425 [Bacteroidota bacterium]